jgi:GGDEF domain-containing protein
MQARDERLSMIRLDVRNVERLNAAPDAGAADQRVRHVARIASELPGARVYRLGRSKLEVELRGEGAWEAFELAQELQSDLASTSPPIWVTAGVAEAEVGGDPARLRHRADVAAIAARSSRRSTVVYSPDLELVPPSAMISGA